MNQTQVNTDARVECSSGFVAQQLSDAYAIFEASPSFVGANFIYDFDGPFQDYPRSRNLHSRALDIADDPTSSDLEISGFAEEWLIHGLLRTFFGPGCRQVPRSSCTLENGTIQRYYSTPVLIAWLMEEIESWQYLLASQPRDLLFKRYNKAFHCYETAQKLFSYMLLS